MKAKCVKELMVPLDDYAVVPHDATLVEAFGALREAEQRLRPARRPARAVLVVDPEGAIVGQLGHLEILQALEPGYCLLCDLGTPPRAGVRREPFGPLIDNVSFWRGELSSVCRRFRNLKVSALMHPIDENISEDTPLLEAAHKMLIWQSMRALVTRRGRVVGVLRLSDLLARAADFIDSDDVGGRSAQVDAGDVETAPWEAASQYG